MELKNYNGKIYLVRDKFTLKFKSGSFHYVSNEILIQAYEANFVIGYDKKVYTSMPWGAQHIGYNFEESEWIKNKFINQVIKKSYE